LPAEELPADAPSCKDVRRAQPGALYRQMVAGRLKVPANFTKRGRTATSKKLNKYKKVKKKENHGQTQTNTDKSKDLKPKVRSVRVVRG
jgi:hypothetical protein